MYKERIFYLDVIRVFATFCIILCHTDVIQYDSVLFEKIKWFMGKCGVPLFFILSGYLAFPFNTGIEDYFKKKMNRIFFPFIFWVVVYLFVAKSLGFPLFESDLLNRASAHLWFVYIIIGLYLLVPVLSPFLEKASRSVLKFYLILWLITTIYPIIISYSNITFSEHNILYSLYYLYGYVGYFVLGFYLKKYDNTRILSLIYVLPMLLFSFTLIYVGFFVLNLQTVVLSDYKGIPIVLYSIAIFSLLKWASVKLETYSIVRKYIFLISESSFGIYLIHMLVVFYIYPFIFVSNVFPNLLVSIGFALGNLIVSCYFINLVKKNSYSKYFIG